MLTERYPGRRNATVCFAGTHLPRPRITPPAPSSESMERATVAPSKQRVICFGHDLKLLQTRELLLESSYDTGAVASLNELLAIAGQKQVHLLVLCHTLSEAECFAAAQIVRSASPCVKVLVLETHASSNCSAVGDDMMQCFDGPAIFLRKAGRLLH